VKALLVLFFLALLVLGLVHLACRPAFIVVRTGQPLPRHYLQAWVFGNLTIVQVAPSHAVVSIGPWP
jgi:hypothetical protein